MPPKNEARENAGPTLAVVVSSSDKERMARLADAFKEAETDDEPDPAAREALIAAANRWRVAHGIPELEDADADPPELELYRRARALGLGEHRR